MNIVHFSAGRINPTAAKVGSTNMIYWLAREQELAGHDVSVVVVPEKIKYENVQGESFAIREYAMLRRKGFAVDPKLFEDIDQGRLKIDVAHLHSLWSPAMVTIAAGLRKRGIPYVISSHGSFAPMLLRKPLILKHIFRFLFGLRLANGASFVHLHSQDEIGDARSFGVKTKLVVAEQGIDKSSLPAELPRDWFKRHYPLDEGKFKIVFLGRLDPWHKGIDLLLHGLKIALHQAPDLRLYLIGPEKQRYKHVIPELVAQLGISERVVLAGPLYEPAEKFAALASADCFALTSRFEGFPLTVLEAMACGTPLIVTPGTNATEIVRSSGAGIACSADPDAIAHALLEMRSNAAERSAMRQRGQQAAAQYTWARSAAILLEAYASVRRDQ